MKKPDAIIPAAQRAPLNSLVLNEGFGEMGTAYLGAEIDGGGALVISGQETAPLCDAMREELDAECWLSVAPAWKDELLLRLLAERFSDSRELVAYLESHGIPAVQQAA
jgi:hypothetical protein